MRRTPTLLLASALALAACGGSDSAASDDTDPEPPTTEQTDGSDDEAEPPADEADESEQAEDDTTVDDADPDPAEDDDPDAARSGKPDVEFPGEAPTELVRTVLIEGSGEPATTGDTVVVDYVGVRALDGVEFDNSYDRGAPFPVVLGSGGVIQGWEDGLEGALEGERVQLDIPSNLAYGEAARSDVIRENEPLTFVIDVRNVITSPDPSDAPTEPGVELSDGEGVADTVFTDLESGDGPELESGDTAILHFVYYRGDNGVQLESSWGQQPLSIQYDETQLLPGLFEGMAGMQVGGRRAITIPPEDGFGPDGNPQGGLPAETDIIFVVDLLGTY